MAICCQAKNKKMLYNNPTAGIILAAGISTRFGAPKQLFKFKGNYLLEWVLDAALNSKLERIILVIGHHHQNIRQALAKKLSNTKIQIIVNHQYREGMSGSLITGLSIAKEKFPSVMFLLGDQPGLNTKTINLLLNRFWKSNKDISVPVYKGKQKNLAIFSKKLYKKLFEIRGDIGAKKIIHSNKKHILWVTVNDDISFFDIDSKKDIELFCKFSKSSGKE